MTGWPTSPLAGHPRVEIWGFGQQAVEYEVALARQRAVHEQTANGGPGVIALLEHPSVYTLGRSTRPEDLPLPGVRLASGAPLPPQIAVDRGGRITWHGPGQLVGYPIVRLPDPTDVVGFVRSLETVLSNACARLGVTTGQVAGRSGLWLPATGDLPPRKVAAIGVRVARGVTMHGFALNCANALEAFDAIVPCGIHDAGVSTLSLAAGRVIGVAEAAQAVIAELADQACGVLVARSA